MAQHRILNQITLLDPEREHHLILLLMLAYEFPFDMARAWEMTLLRVIAIPSISQTLVAAYTGEPPGRIYDDLTLLRSLLCEGGYQSEIGQAVIDRLNQLQAHWPLSNQDKLYVLACLIFEPVRWLENFGRRPLVVQELLASFYFWRAVGQRLDLQDLPARYIDLQRFKKDYESQYLKFASSNHTLALTLQDLLFERWPIWLSVYGQNWLSVLLDDPGRAALGFPHPPAWSRRWVHYFFQIRVALLKRLPERRRPHLPTASLARRYPQDYKRPKQIKPLGPPYGGEI